MLIKQANTEKEFENITNFFWKIWKEEFKLDRFDRINEYKNWIVYFIEDKWEIISAIFWIFTDNKYWIWRLATKYNERWSWYWTLLINRLIKELQNEWYKKIFLSSEISQTKFYKKFWFQTIWKEIEVWNVKIIDMELDIKDL